MKSGFSLIEVLVASAVASMLTIALFLSWGQVQKSVIKVDNTISINDRILLLQRQFEQDFMGICLPISRPYTKPEKEEAVAPAAGDEKKPKVVERVFYATTQTGDNLETLTFLTNNPMQVYWSDRAGGVRPRIARVQYTLKKDETKKEKTVSYTLYRQEKYTLDLDDFTKEGKDGVRSYALISGIKELKLTYWQEVQTKKEGEGDKNKPKIVKDIKKIAIWDLEKEKPNKDVFTRPIPIMIKIELSLWDMQKKKAHAYVAMIPVLVYVPNPEEEQKKKEPSAKSVLSQLPIPERLKKQDDNAQNPATIAISGLPGMQIGGFAVPSNTLSQQVDAQVTMIADDKGTMLKNLLGTEEKGILLQNLLDGKDINAAIPQ